MAMISRKVQQVGGGSFIVSLPKSWADKVGLEKGSSVSMAEGIANTLIIYPPAKKLSPEQTIVLDFSDPIRSLGELVGSYLRGFDLIKVKSKGRIDPKMRNDLKSVIEKLPGLEIVEESSSEISLQCILNPSAINPKKLLERMFKLSKGMVHDSIQSILSADKKLAQLVIARDDEMDRTYFLLVRSVRKAMQEPEFAVQYGLHPIDLLDFRVAGMLIEGIGDKSADISTNWLDVGAPKIEDEGYEILEAAKRLEKLQEESMISFLEQRPRMSIDVRQVASEMRSFLSELERSSFSKPLEEARFLQHLGSVMREIARSCLDILDLLVPSYGSDPRGQGLKLI
ncbi:MAG: hypothetical protein DRO00_04295 [Thermoproteota archaeon]|nr:MAG: hypothetical protein DRN90_01430 [Candidatus Korarchaeota archaeon]RLG53352.1 MAG: hypothetical protein DRO00_04295 [Candidatus Korarchaeota archaeon]